jgi:hypothetical protein
MVAALAAGLGVASAQTPVYSVNAVGYVTKSLTNSYNLIANPLNGTNNSLNTIIPICVEDSYILRWNALGQTFGDPSFYIGGEWIPNDTINPGEAFFLYNSGGNTNITFVGEVPQGSLTNRVANNYSLISQIVPQSINLDAAGVNFPAQEDDYILFWKAIGQTFSDPVFYIGGAWTDNTAAPVGDGFFYFTTAGARNWTRTFSVN